MNQNRLKEQEVQMVVLNNSLPTETTFFIEAANNLLKDQGYTLQIPSAGMFLMHTRMPGGDVITQIRSHGVSIGSYKGIKYTEKEKVLKELGEMIKIYINESITNRFQKIALVGDYFLGILKME